MHVVIIGNGVTGVTAALRLRERQPDWRITMISGESRYHYSRPALMYVFMGHMRYEDTKPYADHTWDEQRIELVRDWVTAIDGERKTLTLHRGRPIAWDRLLITTGSKVNRFGWPGQDLEGVQGLYGLYDLKTLYENARRARHAVVVGGGLIGIELGEMLHSRGIHVTFLVRERSYWDNVLPAEESAMVNRVIRDAGMDLLLATELETITDDGAGHAAGVVTADGRHLEAQIVGLTAGVSPNLDLVREGPIETNRGILVDDGFLTSLPDVFAAGDCAELRGRDGERGLVQQVWYTGKMQGEVVADVLAGVERRYRPGIWYNSAKFLDLEYQVYGRIDAKASGEDGLYWEHPDHRHAYRLAVADGGLIGVQSMGIRLRHRVCERWIAEHRPIAWVLEHLEEANFDPEFFRRHEADVRRTLQEQTT